MKKIRYGVIGGGARGQALMDAAVKTGEIEIAAIADITPENQTCIASPSNSKYSGYREMLESEKLDAVVIATPNDTHAEIVLDCLKAGLPVFCEKPVGISMEEFERVYEAAKSGGIMQVGVELRFSPMMNAIHAKLDRGDIGALRMLWCKEFRPPFRDGQDGWRTSTRNGGSLLEKNVHHFDLFNWYADSRPVKVSAFGGADVIYGDKGILDNAIVNIEYENKVRACLMLGLFHESGFHLELGMLGDGGRMEALVPPERMTAITPETAETREFPRTPVLGRYDHEGEIEQHLAFAKLVRAGKPDISSLEKSKDAHVIALLAQRSIEKGETQYV